MAASNELPAKGEGLEALWDRFLIRLVCSNIKEEAVFRQMLCEQESDVLPPVPQASIQQAEYKQWQQEAQ